MTVSIFFTNFKTKGAMDVGVAWMEVLDRVVRLAATRSVMLDFRHQSGHHAAYGALLDRLSSRRKRRSAEAWYRARLGYAIEAEANAILRTGSRGGWRCLDHRPTDDAKTGDFLLQTPGRRGRLFPCHFGGAAGEGSRPDVRVALGDETEALFDITSRGEEGHVLDKGGGHWLEMPHVAFIAEVIYDEDEVAEIIARRDRG